MRLFVALLLDTSLQEIVAETIRTLRRLDPSSQVRWVDPGGVHLTLKFLGEVPETRVPALEGGLDGAVRGRPVPLVALTGLGAFPNARRPRVLWMGLEETGSALAELQVAIEAAAESLGWEREKRAFQPHLTLGRVREDRGGASRALPPALLQAIAPAASEARTPRPQARVALMRSHLSPRGAHYEERRVWELRTD